MLLYLTVGALMIGGVYGVIALGYSLIYKASGLMSLCQGDMLMFGAFLGLTFYQYLQLPFVLALLMTMIVMFIIGVAIQRVLISELLKRGSQFAYVILCTIAISMLLQNGSMIIWGRSMYQMSSPFATKSVPIFGVNIAPESLVVLLAAVVCMLGLYFFMAKTRFGTAMRAAAMDSRAASTMGINVLLTRSVTWGLAASLAGAIGMVMGPVYGVYTSMGILIGQKAFSSAVSGGYGNIYGAIIGGVFFGFLETFVAAYVTSLYKDFISFAILIVILIFMPTGLFREQVLE